MKQNKETLKQFFETGDKPTQQQYADLIDSYIDAKQPQGEANRRFVIDETGEVIIGSEQEVPEYTLSDIVNNKLSLLKDGVVVKEIDLTTYIDDTNLARLVSGTVDANGLATFTRDDSTTFTVDLSGLKDTVPQYQAGTNITIDNTDPNSPIINASGGAVTPTGLEQVTEEGKKGWRLIGRNPSNYGSIGTNAVDLSINDYGSSTKGATGNYSHSEGLSTSASGTGSHSEGQNTLASGDKSHAEGNLTIASGDSSHAGGMYNTAPSFCERVIGMFGTNYTPNSDTLWNANDRLFNIGNGTDNLNANRSDAFTVLKNGTITAPSLTNTLINTAGNKSLITKEYADANYASGGTTDLSYNASTRTLASSTGIDAVLPIADASNAGLMKANFYEEGTFTPVLVDAGGGATYSSSASGKFTRIGNLVHFEISIGGINTSGTPSGDLRVTGLPILVSGSYASISHGFEGILGVAPPVLDAVSNYFRLSNGIEFLYKDVNGNLSQVSSAVISNGTIRISGQYMTNVYTP